MPSAWLSVLCLDTRMGLIADVEVDLNADQGLD